MAVAVAVSGGGAVAVAGLTNRFFNHPKRSLNQCLGLRASREKYFSSSQVHANHTKCD